MHQVMVLGNHAQTSFNRKSFQILSQGIYNEMLCCIILLTVYAAYVYIQIFKITGEEARVG